MKFHTMGGRDLYIRPTGGLNVILANIYLENRTNAVKMVAGSQDMTISSLSSAKKERIEKGRDRPKTNTHATGC